MQSKTLGDNNFYCVPIILYFFLDVAETGSEAWSIDVLASDTESLRLAELDNEDTGSMARSDYTTRRYVYTILQKVFTHPSTYT